MTDTNKMHSIIREQHPMQSLNILQLQTMYAARKLCQTVQTGHAAHPNSTVSEMASAFRETFDLHNQNDMELKDNLARLLLGLVNRQYYLAIMREMATSVKTFDADYQNADLIKRYEDVADAADYFIGKCSRFMEDVVTGEQDVFNFGIIEEVMQAAVNDDEAARQAKPCDCEVCAASRGEDGAVEALLGALFGGSINVKVKAVQVARPLKTQSMEEFVAKNPGDFMDYVKSTLEARTKAAADEARGSETERFPEDVKKNTETDVAKPEAAEDNAKLVPFQGGWVRNDDPQYLASLSPDKGDAFMYGEGFQAKAPDEPKEERQGGDKDLRDL